MLASQLWGTQMHVADAIATRKSVRAFKSDPVPRATLEEILTLAARAPSGGNLQPWRVYVLLGDARDELVHRVAEDSFFLCVNASNQDKDCEHIRDANRWRAQVDFASDRYAQIAIQGPKALATLQKLTSTPLAGIRY